MRDSDLVKRAERAAFALERAWGHWRATHGLGDQPLPPVSSYVGYSVEEPWGHPRVIFGVDVDEAERLAAVLEGHDCVGPVHAELINETARPADDARGLQVHHLRRGEAQAAPAAQYELPTFEPPRRAPLPSSSAPTGAQEFEAKIVPRQPDRRDAQDQQIAGGGDRPRRGDDRDTPPWRGVLDERLAGRRQVGDQPVEAALPADTDASEAAVPSPNGVLPADAVYSAGPRQADDPVPSLDVVRSADTAEPVTTAQPTAEARSGAEEPASTAKPAGTAKPSATAAPSGTAKPSATAAPSGTAKPSATAKPSGNTKPSSTAKSSATAKPSDTAKSTAAAKSTPTTRAGGTARRSGTTRAGGATRSASTAKQAAAKAASAEESADITKSAPTATRAGAAQQATTAKPLRAEPAATTPPPGAVSQAAAAEHDTSIAARRQGSDADVSRPGGPPDSSPGGSGTDTNIGGGRLPEKVAAALDPHRTTPVHAIAPEKAYPQARSRTAAQSRDAHAATGKRKEGAQQAGPGYRGPRYEGSPPKYKPGGSDKPGDAMPVGHKADGPARDDS